MARGKCKQKRLVSWGPNVVNGAATSSITGSPATSPSPLPPASAQPAKDVPALAGVEAHDIATMSAHAVTEATDRQTQLTATPQCRNSHKRHSTPDGGAWRQREETWMRGEV